MQYKKKVQKQYRESAFQTVWCEKNGVKEWCLWDEVFIRGKLSIDTNIGEW